MDIGAEGGACNLSLTIEAGVHRLTNMRVHLYGDLLLVLFILALRRVLFEDISCGGLHAHLVIVIRSVE